MLSADLLANAAEAMVATDERFVITFWNRAAEELFGWSAEEVVGEQSSRILRPDNSKTDDVISRVMEAGTSRGEVTYERKEGSRVVTEVRCAALRGPAGEFRGTVSGFRDVTARSQAENALRQSEQRLQTVLRQAPLGIGVLDLQGACLACNDRFTAMMPCGVSFEEHARTSRWRAWAEDGRVLEPDAYPQRRALRGETVCAGVDFQCPRPDGSEAWIQVSASPLTGERGEVIGAIVVVAEITEQKRMEQALRTSESRYRALFDTMDEGVCLFERIPDREHDYRLLAMNTAMQAMFGIPDLSGRSLRETFPDEDEAWYGEYDRVLETGVPVRFVRASEPQGKVIEMFVTRQEDDSGRRLLAVIQDVTRQHRAEIRREYLLVLSDALRPLSNALEIHQTVTRIAMEHFGADRCYYCEIDGERATIRRDSARGDLPSVAGVYPLDSFPLFRRVLDGRVPFVVENAHTSELLDEPLRRLCVEMAIISFLDVPVIKDGKPVGVLCITRCSPRVWTEHEVELAVETAERTWPAVERARAEEALLAANERLLESDRRKDEFLAMLGHELRNPLAGIRNAAELIKQLAPEDARLERAQGVLERQSSQMTRLIDGLLEVSRIARGKIRLNRETLDARQVVTAVLQDRRPQAQARGLELTPDLPATPVWIDADRVRMVQVLDNLIGNAIKFTEAGGRIRVTLEATHDTVAFRISDTGVGIRPEMLDRIFEPFQQDTQELSRSAGGLGLGLALAKGLLELHGGAIEAHSAGPAMGADFEVRLPLAPAPVVEGGAEAVEVASRRILVVEDNRDAAESLRDLLEMFGHRVDVAETGDQALALLAEQGADVVLCDLGLPGMSGFDVARAIRNDRALSATTLVALTGYGQPEDRRKTQEAGFDVHLVKPVTIGVLNEVLRRT